MRSKTMAVLILFIFLFSVVAVSAADEQVSTEDMLSVDDNNETYGNYSSSIDNDEDNSVLTENDANPLNDDNSTHFGYWAWSTDVPTLNFTDLSSHGVTDIFLNYYAFQRFNESVVESLALTAKENGINVHIWAQIFKDSEFWTRPVDRNGNVNYEAFDRKTAELEYYASVKGIAGIHYDYLRFSGSEYYNNTAWQNPGGKEAITYFVKKSTEAIRKINPDLIISAAIMPEPDSLERIYGVEYSEISKYMDVIIPMVYRGNFKQDTAWVGQITKFFIDNSSGSTVWTGLQGYVDDDNMDKFLPEVQMKIDGNTALDAGAKGVIVFKINCCENIDFINLSIDENQLNSFKYLYYKTSSAYKTLNLENDFAYNESTDKELIDGIKIYRNNLIINGNNHIIDAKNMARIFNITANNITLMNIRFKNALDNAILISGENVRMINCSFITDEDNHRNDSKHDADGKDYKNNSIHDKDSNDYINDSKHDVNGKDYRNDYQNGIKIIGWGNMLSGSEVAISRINGTSGNGTSNESGHAGFDGADNEKNALVYWGLLFIVFVLVVLILRKTL